MKKIDTLTETFCKNDTFGLISFQGKISLEFSVSSIIFDTINLKSK